jgi:hypothetical protein
LHPRDIANKDIPRSLRARVKRYVGTNPHGKPLFRVVWAQNVLEQSFGSMRHMPRVSVDSDLTDIEPERFESGEFWTPKYSSPGLILERWGPPEVYGSKFFWEHEIAEDGVTRLMGEYPRHGGYFMVNDDFIPEMRGFDFWAEEIQKELRRQANSPHDPVAYLQLRLYLLRTAEKEREEKFLEEVNYIHKSAVAPLLATVGRTAQRVRDDLMFESGLSGHLSAG